MQYLLAKVVRQRRGGKLMLGYTEQDIDAMKVSLNIASFYLPPSKDDVATRLQEIHDFLEGLQVEGRI
jgi:hypothetical protein